MQKILRRLLNLEPGEGRPLAVLYVLGFVIATSLVWGSAIGRGLFLKRVGIEWLPLMFVFDGLLALPVTLIYTAVVDRVNNARLLATIFGGVGLVLLAAWGLLFLDQWGISIPYLAWVYALFYLAERVLRALFAVHAWTFFNDYLDIRAAKRLFPILGSTSRVAGVVAGPLVAVLAGYLSAQNLVLAWIAVLVVGVWLSLSTPRWLAASQAGEPAADRTSAVSAYWQNLRGGFRFVTTSSFLRWLAVGAFAMTALLVLMDYQAQRVFNGAYATAEGLISFYGILETVINLVALPVQMFLISRLVAWWGVARVNLLYPLGSAVIYAALSVWPSLSTAMAGQFGRDTFRSSVQVPVDNMLYNAVPAAVKGRARAFIKALLLPLATVAIGLVLLPVRQAGILPWWVIGIGGAAALVQLLAAFLVQRRYTQALVTMLSDEDYGAYRAAVLTPAGAELGPPDPATYRRLLERMRASHDPDFTLFLAQIVAEAGGREACRHLVEVAGTAGPQVQASILETLLETGIADESAIPFCRQILEAEETAGEGRLRRAALAVLERLMGADAPDLWPLAAGLLGDADPETRLPAILLLVHCGDFFYLAQAVSSLNELLSDGACPARRAAGLRLLQAMGDARMVRNLVRYLDDPDDGVRLAAARSIEALADPQAPGWAVTLAREAVARELADPVEGVRLCALRTLGRVGDQAAQERLIAALADPSDLVRQQASAGLVAQGRAAAPALEALLVEGESPELLAQGAALVLARMARERIVGTSEGQRYLRQADALFEDTLRRVYADVRLLAALEPLKPGQRRPARKAPAGLDSLLPGGARRRGRPGGASPRGDSGEGGVVQLLGEGLRQRNERRLDGAFRLLGVTRRGPASSIDVIVGTLRGSPAGSTARANALEALESLTSSRLAHLVGGVVPFPAPGLESGDGAAMAGLVAVGEREWALEPLEVGAALEAVVADADRWLAAMGVVALAETGLFEAAMVQEAWWPVWQADPDPAVREAACYVARRMNLEVEMVDTTEMATLETLSAVERAIFLKQIPFFGAMTVDQLRTLAGIAEEQDYDEAETIFAEGDLGEALYVVVRGRVAIEREPREGQVQRLETLSARQYFGERTIFDGAPHENRAVALERVHLLAIRREPLLALFRRSPDLSLSLVTVLSQRLREADSKLAAKTRPKPDQVMRLYDKLTGEE